MYSAMNKSASETIEKSTTIDITNLSPVTNLTLNLVGLSTSVAGTPIRRISWSNPLPGGDKIGLNLDDLSPTTTDSPSFHDILPHREKLKHKVRKCSRKAFISDSDVNKENLTPDSKNQSQPSPVDFEENVFPCSSQDSGYSSVSISNNISTNTSVFSSSYTKVRSNIFSYEDDDSMESIFHLDCLGDSQEMSPAPGNISSLLTKPLSSQLKSQYLTSGQKRDKLPIRRCLSMDIESDSETSISVSENTSTNGTFLSSMSISEECCAKLDLNEKGMFKRPDPPSDDFIYQSKRRKSSPSVEQPPASPSNSIFQFRRSYSETAATIMHAIQKSDLQPELIGDGSRSYVLPISKGRHQDLKSITPETMSRLLKGEFKDEVECYTLVDCRYPYEFEGGHIQGAKNIYTKEDIIEVFFKNGPSTDKTNVLIFHCEFSSERAPNLCRFMRNKDRENNQGNYPHLHFPEIYILEGGYKAFFESHQEMCEPQGYKQMTHKDHGFELRHFRAKSKSWGADCKSRAKLRSHSKTSVI